MKQARLAIAIVTLSVLFTAVPTMHPAAEAQPAVAPTTVPARIVFIGDSITDGNTYPLMVQQALRAAGAPVPEVINAGIGGDTAQGMSKRLDRDVLLHRPTLVTLSAGINDALRGVTLADYSASITTIADRLRDEKIPLLLLTTSVYGAKHIQAEWRSAEYNAWLRRFAAVRNLRVAEVEGAFSKARAEKGIDFVMEPDAVHPNWQGQRLIARAVLDALGFAAAPVPETLQLQPLPGVIPSWSMRVAPDGKTLDDAAARALLAALPAGAGALPDATPYPLPEAAKQEHPWMEQERQLGYALSLDKVVGPGKLYQGLAILDNPDAAPRTVVFQTGAQLQRVWLNGERLYEHKEWHGWHAGRDRITATLRPGRNTVLIESGTQFFLSVVPVGE